jgi:endonuclease YncB( thermonuclease family)
VVQDIDRYGRTIGRVFVGGVDVNAALVEQGAAWVYRTPARRFGVSFAAGALVALSSVAFAQDYAVITGVTESIRTTPGRVVGAADGYNMTVLVAGNRPVKSLCGRDRHTGARSAVR